MKRLLFTLATLIIATSLFPSEARAQSGEHELIFSVSPAIVEVAGNPGETIEASVTFANPSDKAAAAFIVSDALVPIDNIVDQSRRSEFDASAWIELETSTVAFDAKTRSKIPFKITIPELANPGSHYALLTLKPGVIEGPSQDTVILPELSASIFITVAGNINEEAELVEEDLEIPNLTMGSDNTLDFRIRNTGNVHILPTPKLSILKDGKPIEIFSLQPQLILPNTEKTFSVEWDTDVSIGAYSLQAELTYGTQSIPLSSSQHEFWVLPNPLHVFLLILGSPLIITLLIKRRNLPRTLAVLRGHANFSGKPYKRDPGQEDLPDTTKKEVSRTLDEIAKELEKRKPVLGLPVHRHKAETDEIKQMTKEAPPPPSPPPPKKKPVVISKTRQQSSDKTTFITQTSASTIVREASPFFDPDADTEQPAKKIPITHADDDAGKPKKTKKPKTSPKPKKKPAIKKIAATRPKQSTKTTRNKPAAKKTATKKPTKSTTKSKTAKKTTTKKASTTKPTAKKLATKKAATPKKQAKKESSAPKAAKKSSTAKRKSSK